MSEKTRAELKEQIKIMNHNYQTIKEMHERGYQYSVVEIKRLQDDLERTRKALEIAVDALKKYTDASGNWWYGYEFQGHYEDYAGEYADKALEQITATLENQNGNC